MRPRKKLRHVGGSILLASAIVGCGSASLPPSTHAPEAAGSFDEGRWGRYESSRFRLVIRLPDGRNWRIDDRGSPWLTATHSPTSSEVYARSWDEARAASREACLDRIRERSPEIIPDLEGMGTVTDEVQAIDSDGDEASARVRVAVEPGSEGEIRGTVLVSGVSIRRCFALVFTTSASGAGAEAVIADRLATVTHGLVPKLRLVSTLQIPGPVEAPRSRP